MSIAAFISGEVGPGVTIPLFVTRGLGVGEAIEAVAENTGGFEYAWRTYRDDEQVRKQRIAMKIIPEDEPDRQEIIEAAELSVDILAKRKIRALERKSEDLDRLEARTLELMAAQREAQEAAYNDLVAELNNSKAEFTQLQRNQNAIAVLTMLGLI